MLFRRRLLSMCMFLEATGCGGTTAPPASDASLLDVAGDVSEDTDAGASDAYRSGDTDASEPGDAAVTDAFAVDAEEAGGGVADAGAFSAENDSEGEGARDVVGDASSNSSDASLIDAMGDTPNGDVVKVYTIEGGALGDGSCPTDLRRGFVSGTEVCAMLSSSLNGGNYLACLTSGAGGSLVCAHTYASFRCRPIEAQDGVVLLLGLFRFPMGQFLCSAANDTVALDGGLCCEAVVVDAGAGSTTYFVTGNVLDTDQDGVPDIFDNCPLTPNFNQSDIDRDGIGDVCDDCPYTYDPDQTSMADGGIGNACNCALPSVILGANGCPCADGGAGSSTDAGDLCGLIVTADGGLADGG